MKNILFVLKYFYVFLKLKKYVLFNNIFWKNVFQNEMKMSIFLVINETIK